MRLLSHAFIILYKSGADLGRSLDLAELPAAISSSYLAQANFWLTCETHICLHGTDRDPDLYSTGLPMRGFLAFCELSHESPLPSA